MLLLAQEQRGEVEKIAGVKVHSFVCIPVARKGSEDLIALACLVNKINEPRLEFPCSFFRFFSLEIIKTLYFSF